MRKQLTCIATSFTAIILLGSGCGFVQNSAASGQKALMLQVCVPSVMQESERLGQQIGEERARHICSCAFDEMQQQLQFSEWTPERQAEWMRSLEQKSGEMQDIYQRCIAQQS